MSLENSSKFLRIFSSGERKASKMPSYRFKSFVLDVSERQLLNGDETIPLTPKVFDTLVYLVERAGHLAEKDAIMHAVWSDSIVEEGNLSRSIHTLRRALGQDENGNKFIETVPTKGYRFVADVTINESITGDEKADEDDFPEFVGESNTEQATATTSTSDTRHSLRFLWIGAGFLLAFGLIAVLSFYRQPTTGLGQPVSIAVLPLRSLKKDDPDTNYKLAVADSLVSHLAAAKEIKVLPLSATWQFLDSETDAASAGKALNVQYVLASNYQIVDGKIRMTSQLINVETGAVDETFKSERDLAGAFQTQDMIAADVGSAVIKRFGLLAGDIVRRRGTTSEEAHGYVLQAAYVLDNKRRGDISKSLDLVERAIALDPNFARAYAVRAYAYRRAAWGHEKSGLTVYECYIRAKEAIETAIRLDANSSDAYAMLGEIKDTYEWRSDEADAAHRRSIELDPNSAHARRFYALFLMNEERFDTAIEQIKAGIEIEPASVFGQRILGQIYHRAGRYDEAIVQLKRVLEMDPSFTVGSGMIWRSYYLKGDRETAYQEYRKRFERSADADRLAKIDSAYEAFGWEGVFRFLTESQAGAQADSVSAYISLGEHDKALALLEEQASDTNRNRAAVIFLGRWLDPLRKEPRFQELMKKLGY